MMSTEPEKPKALETQRTFDSTDDLLGTDSDEEIVGTEVAGSTKPSATTQVDNLPSISYHPPKNIWDCQAICWPPRSPIDNAKAALKYARNPYHYLEVAVLGLFLLACYKLPDYLVAAHQRPIPYQTTSAGDTLIDLTFANPYHHNETIPGSLLTLLTVVIPMVLFWVVANAFGPRGDFHGILCAYLLSMACKIFVVACIKNYAGYFRPSFYNMCQFNYETLACNDETTSARESFPSGHAATAMSSMTLVALYLLAKVRGSTHQRGILAEKVVSMEDTIWTPSLLEKTLALIAVSPVFLGMFIATSRVRDNWHHPADVVCGGLIGVGCSMFAHSLWFPSVYSYYAGIPLETVSRIIAARKRLNAPLLARKVDLDDKLVDV